MSKRLTESDAFTHFNCVSESNLSLSAAQSINLKVDEEFFDPSGIYVPFSSQ